MLTALYFGFVSTLIVGVPSDWARRGSDRLVQGLAAAFNVLGISGIVFLAVRWGLLNDGFAAIAALVLGIGVAGIIGNGIAPYARRSLTASP
jgi:hypothetical protein